MPRQSGPNNFNAPRLCQRAIPVAAVVPVAVPVAVVAVAVAVAVAAVPRGMR